MAANNPAAVRPRCGTRSQWRRASRTSRSIGSREVTASRRRWLSRGRQGIRSRMLRKSSSREAPDEAQLKKNRKITERRVLRLVVAGLRRRASRRSNMMRQRGRRRAKGGEGSSSSSSHTISKQRDQTTKRDTARTPGTRALDIVAGRADPATKSSTIRIIHERQPMDQLATAKSSMTDTTITRKTTGIVSMEISIQVISKISI